MVDILHVCPLCYMLISEIAVIYSTPGRNPISTAAYTPYTPPILHIPALYYTPPILPIPARPIPSLSFRPLCCRYVGLIKPNSAHCIIICVLPIYLREQASWPPLITFNIELLPGSSMHHTRGRLQDYNSILPNSKRSFFTSRSGVCREYPAWLKPMKNRQMCFLKTPFSPMPLLNLVIVDMQHASSQKHHKSREIHIFEEKKVENAAPRK